MDIKLIGNKPLLGALVLLAFGCGEAAENVEKNCPGSDTVLEGDGQSFTTLALGSSGACGVINDGTLLCWGTSIGMYVPEPVSDMDQVSDVVVGSPRTCVIRPGGSVTCWSDFDPAAAVPGLCGATMLALSVGAQCAVVSDGSVRCWGGLNETVFGRSSSRTPVKVPGVSDATAVAVGASGYTCALISDGSVTCWGGGPRAGDRPGIEPAPVPEISGAVALAGSDQALGLDMCAIVADGGVTCWSRAIAPAPVPSVEGAISLAHGPHDCVALADGSVRCWGRNSDGQLGNGTNDSSDSPVLVEGLSGVTQVAVNGLGSSAGHSCALLDDGSARCWGSNFKGQLGNGELLDSNTPVEVLFP